MPPDRPHISDNKKVFAAIQDLAAVIDAEYGSFDLSGTVRAADFPAGWNFHLFRDP
jgi:hypothetical protein